MHQDFACFPIIKNVYFFKKNVCHFLCHFIFTNFFRIFIHKKPGFTLAMGKLIKKIHRFYLRLNKKLED
jgi:hypothetical protein